MRIIDADTHVDETEDTWEYMQGDDLQLADHGLSR